MKVLNVNCLNLDVAIILDLLHSAMKFHYHYDLI